MSGLIGPVGGLESVWFTNSEPENVEPRHSYSKALSGRVTAQRSARPRRSWSCGMDESLPEDYHIVEQLARWPDPMVWYSAASCRSNILTPEQSWLGGGTWTGGAEGGAGKTPDGVKYYGSRTSGLVGDVRLASPVAVPGRSPVTASIYVSTHPTAPAILYVDEIDPEGAVVEEHQVSVPADSFAVRAVVGFTTSVRTVAVKIRVVGALMVALPAATLTASVRPWATGRGCETAVVDMGGEKHHFGQVAPDGDMRVTSRTFTINELG